MCTREWRLCLNNLARPCKQILTLPTPHADVQVRKPFWLYGEHFDSGENQLFWASCRYVLQRAVDYKFKGFFSHTRKRKREGGGGGVAYIVVFIPPVYPLPLIYTVLVVLILPYPSHSLCVGEYQKSGVMQSSSTATGSLHVFCTDAEFWRTEEQWQANIFVL